MKKFNVTVNGTVYEVEVNEVGGAAPAAAPKAAPAAAPAPKAAPAAAPAPKAAAPVAAGAATVKCPMPGKILSVAVSAGTAVKKGDLLLVLEAMKMQNEITANCNGVIRKIKVQVGQSVMKDELLVEIQSIDL